MTIEHGIVVGGRVIPGTERVIRDGAAWWTEGRETRPRDGATIDMLIGHYTAGPARTGPGAGRSLFRAMEVRQNAHGEDLSVSVQMSISWDGLIWQHADLEVGCVHVGARPVIRRSIGVECMWPGSSRSCLRAHPAGPCTLTASQSSSGGGTARAPRRASRPFAPSHSGTTTCRCACASTMASTWWSMAASAGLPLTHKARMACTDRGPRRSFGKAPRAIPWATSASWR